MSNFSISPIAARPASEASALDCFEARCSCGLVMSSSMPTIIAGDVRDHLAWHTRRGDDAVQVAAVPEESMVAGNVSTIGADLVVFRVGEDLDSFIVVLEPGAGDVVVVAEGLPSLGAAMLAAVDYAEAELAAEMAI